MNRRDNLSRLQQEQPFDLVIIGAGATGCGIAVDAASRGLNVALIERNDIAEGTSSRSTKLVHGGVRYLEKAVRKLDRVQFNLVRDGLRERRLLLRNARHLANRLALVTPIYKWHEIPYIFSGLRFYDLLSGRDNIGHSRLLSRKEALRRYPGLKAEGLKAGVLYYDGQFHDSRMALSLALTAQQQGAVICNHLEVSALQKQNGRVSGVRVRNRIDGTTFSIDANGVINATGPFCDEIRRLDNPQLPPLLTLSSGIHIVIDKKFAPPDTGLMIPETADGRVLFVLPWEGHALVGTTDNPAELSEHPRPGRNDVDYLIHHLEHYFNISISHNDVKACWSGLRPLVTDPQAHDTAGLARDHLISTSSSRLLTICGGKWTTYRKMAEDTVTHAISLFGLNPPHPACSTRDLNLLGSAGYSTGLAAELSAQFSLPADIAAYLARNYGDQALLFLENSTGDDLKRLHPAHPVIRAEIGHAVRNELAEHAIDFLARRTPLALIDNDAAKACADNVVEIMGSILDWSSPRRQAELELCKQRLNDAL